MNPGVEYYRPFGLQAAGYLTVLHVPEVGDTVAIAGVTYTFGTDFFGQSVNEVALSLASTINADRAYFHVNPAKQLNPSRSVYAIFYGNIISIIASVPGTAGNSLALVTSNALAITVSGATLSGGAAGSISLSTSVVAVTPSVIIKTVTLVTVPEALGPGATEFQRVLFRAYKAARTQNTGKIWIQLSGTDASAGIDLEPGESHEFVAPEGKKFTAAQFYIDVESANDGVTAFLF